MQGHGSAHDDPKLLPVSVSTSIVAVLLAAMSLLGHRAHTHTIYAQNEAIAQWVYYESKTSGRTFYDALMKFLPAAQAQDPGVTEKIRRQFAQNISESEQDLKRIKVSADALETEVTHQEQAADRFDLADVCLEAALVIMSITMLTKRRFYWLLGLALAGVGLVVGGTAFFVA